MASICNINDSKQQKLAEYLVTILRNNTKIGPEELKQLVKRIYQEVTNQTQNPSQGLVYASLVPFWTFKILAFNDSLRDQLDADTAAIDKVRKQIDKDNEFTYLKKYIGLGAEVENVIKEKALQESLENSFKANAIVEDKLINIVKRRLRGRPSLWTTELTEMDQDGNVKPEEVGHYNVMRTMLDVLARSQKMINGEIQAEIPSVGPVFFKLVSLKEFAKTNKVKNDLPISDNQFIYAMVDSEGKYVSLDADMMPVSAEEGITPYFNVVSEESMKLQEYYVKNALANLLFSDNMLVSYSELSPEQQKQIDEKYETEKRILLKSMEYARKNPGEGYVFSVKGGVYTNVPSDYIGDIAFDETQPFAPQIDNSLTTTSPGFFVYNGKKYVISPQPQKSGVPNSGIELQHVNNILSLIFDPVYKEDGTELSVAERRKELNKYVYVMPLTNLDSKNNVLIDNGKDLYVEYTDAGLVIKTKYNANKEFRGVKGQLDLYAKKLTDISNLDRERQKQLMFALFKNLGYYRIAAEGIDNSDQYNWPVLTTDEDGDIVITYDNSIDYVQWLKTSKGFKIENPDDTTNPYVVLQPNQEMVNNIISDDPMVVRFYEKVTGKQAPSKKTTAIVFKEDTSSGYSSRTKINTSADATLAIAYDFETAGEKLTRKSVESQKKQYIGVPLPVKSKAPKDFMPHAAAIDFIVNKLNEVNAKTLNIAGNGIYTLKDANYTQEEIDQITYNLLKAILESPNLKTKIESVRTGGQTGFDEAGAKAASKLGIQTTVLAPKGWKFRDINSKDISDKEKFIARFETKPDIAAQEEEKPKRKKREKKVKPNPEDAPSSRENPATQDNPSPLDIVNKALENKKKGFKFKLVDVKGNEVKATSEQIEEAKTWYDNLEVEIDGKKTKLTDLVPYKVMFDSVNSDYKNSVAFWNINKGIVLLQGADYSDLYHEAWHAFTQTFLTKDQRKRLYKEVSKYEGDFKDYRGNKVKFSEATEDQLEEYLAENFREYVLSKGTKAKNPTPVKMNIFQKIWNFIKSFFSNRTVQDVAENPTSGKYVDELYEKLRLGNLSEFKFDSKNRTYDQLAKGTIKPISRADAASYSFTYTESKEILDTVDSIISDLASKLNSENGNTRATVGLFKGTNKLIAYQIVKETFTDGIIPKLRAELQEINQKISQEKNPEKLQKLEVMAMRKEKYITLAQKAVTEFGDTENLEANRNMKAGVIYQHITSSEFVSDEERDEFLKDLDEGKTGKEPEMYSKSPQKSALVDLASDDVLNLVRGLYQFDRSGKPVMNEFGVPKLVDFVKTWNFLAKNLEGMLQTDKMYEKMESMAKVNPMMRQLLSKLGPYEARITTDAKRDGVMFGLQTNFWQAFNKTRVPLVQLTFTEDIEYVKQTDSDGNTYTVPGVTSYVTTVGYATGEVNKVKTNWNNAFFSSSTKYINDIPYEAKNKVNISNKELNIDKVLADFPRVPVSAKGKLEFLSAIGITIKMGADVLKQMEINQDIINAVSFTHQRLKDLKDNNMTVKFIGDMFSERPNTEMVEQTHLLNYLANLEARFGDTVTSFMSTTADGETQFEHSLNSSFTRIVYELNEAKNKAMLDALPHMQHLSPSINKFTKGNRSIWMHSLFNSKGGDKRVDFRGRINKMMFENLSGIKAIEDSGSENGVKTSEADPLAKLLLDFHSSSLRGTPELMTLSDKTSTYNASIDRVYNPFDSDKKQQHRYIDDGDFLLSEGRSSVEENSKDTKGNRLFFMVMSNYLYSEIERMRTMKDIMTNKEKNKLDYDYEYVKRGSDFVIFDDILSKDTKKKLRAKLNLFNETNIENKGLSAHDFIQSNFPEVEDEIHEYLNKQYSAVKAMMDEAGYIDDQVVSNIKRNVREKLDDRTERGKIDIDDYKDAAIRSFVANSWIHNMESIIMVFGDVAIYNIEKDEFHKRNAGFTSTGDLFRTDRLAIQFVNEEVGNPYAETIPGMIGDVINDDGSINTAVMEDTEHTAVFYTEYRKIFLDHYFELNPTKSISNPDDLAKAQEYADVTLKNYRDYKEGDGQGWVTFDMYRKLLVLEGKWDWDVQEKLFQDIVSGKDVSKEKIIKFFPVKKLQYMGPVVTKSLPVMAMHKFSLMPLIPNIIKNTNLDKLHNRMLRNGIGYAMYKSASKVGTITDFGGKSDKFYSDPRTLQFDEFGKFTKNTIFLHYLKDQLETGEEFKNKVTFATQMRKLIIEGMVENGVPIDFMKNADANARVEAWEKLSEKERMKYPKYERFRKYEKLVFDLTESKYAELLDRIGWTLDSKGKPKGDMENLVNYIVTNLDRQDIAPHELSFISLKGGKLKFDLSASFNAEQIEKLLNSIVVRELIRQKVNGEPLIQVAKSGWEKPTSEDIAKFGDDLPFYRPLFNKSGKHVSTTAMKIKVALKGDFKKLLNLDAVKELAETPEIKEKAMNLNYDPRLVALNTLIKDDKWLNEGDNRSMVTIVATRIPVQGLNSMDFMEVFDFLPENAGNIIIMPREIVAKSGSDFDIDKMFTMMPSMYSVFGEVKYIKHSAKISKVGRKRLMDEENSILEKRKAIQDKYDDIIERKDKQAEFKFTDTEIAKLKALKKQYFTDLREVEGRLSEAEAKEDAYLKGKLKDYDAETLYLELWDIRHEMFELDERYNEDQKKIIGDFNKEVRTKLFDARDKELKPLNKEFVDIHTRLLGSTSKGIENELLNVMREVLEDPDNFVTMMRPNSTDIFDDLSQEMAPFASDYSPTAVFNDEPVRINSKTGKPTISGTRVLEIPFNIYKRDTTNIGKQVLGIGAVENTYNILYNRIGMYLNYTSKFTYEEYMQKRARYDELDGLITKAYKEKNRKLAQSLTEERNILKAETKNFDFQEILMPHNTMVKDGKNVISLSGIYTKDGRHKVADIISQMINGWVDVAKDQWIFNVQGNKEVAPSLLLLVEAGVPIEHAVYFVSQPLVREYVARQRRKKSVFAKAMGVAPENANMFRYDTRKEILDEFDIVNVRTYTNKMGETFEWLDSRDRFDKTQEMNNLMREKIADSDVLKDRLQEFKDQADKEYTDLDKAVLLHFLQIEDMAAASQKFKLTTNVDTSKARSLFEASSKELAVADLKSEGRIPEMMIDRITGEGGAMDAGYGTAISSFFKALKYQQSIWGPLFKVRNNKEVKNFLLGYLSGPMKIEILENTFGNDYTGMQKFSTTFLNDLMTYLFQNKLYEFDLQGLDSFKGYEASFKAPKAKVVPIVYSDHSVYFVDGKVYINRNKLQEDWLNLDTNDENYPKEYTVASVTRSTFPNEQHYYRFVLEREYIRSRKDFDKISQTSYYKDRYQANSKKNADKSTDEIKRISYEETIRDMALMNSFNMKFMFGGNGRSMADTLELIKSKHKDTLVKQFSLLENLSIYKYGGVANIKMMASPKDPDTRALYNEQMTALMDPSQLDIDGTQEEKEFISNFFQKLPFFSILQAGYDTNLAVSIQRIMPWENYMMFMNDVYKQFTDKGKTFDREFLENFMMEFMRQNSIKNRQRNRMKAYNRVDGMDLGRMLFPEDYDHIDDTVNTNVIDVRSDMNGLPKYKLQPFTEETHGSLDNYISELAKVIMQGNRVYIFNDVVDSSVGNPLNSAKKADWVFKKVLSDYPSLSDKIIGLPTRTKYVNQAAQARIPESMVEPNDDFVEAFQKAIDQINYSDKELVFNESGYGQILIGADDVTAELPDKTPNPSSISPVTFDYISTQLLDNFGYLNPNFQNEEGIKAYQGRIFTLQDILEQINLC